jgi:hypothetical protein
MVTNPNDATMVLLELKDLDQLPDIVRDYEDALYSIVEWARAYLIRPHPELGRKGPVCPFARGSLDRGLFYLAVYRGRPAGPEDVAGTLGRYRDWFLELGSSAGSATQFQTILVLFPDIAPSDAPALLDASQEALKAAYVSRGLMIGEFHDGPPPKGGLWNEEFRPLRSPVPLLAIRHLVPTDFPFLRNDRDFVAAYLANVADHEIPAKLRPEVAVALQRFELAPSATS